MAFWSDTSLDPKRQYKFKVTFGYLQDQGVNSNASTYLAQSADRPVYQISDGTKIDYLDKSFHFPGKITWTPVKIKFVDTVTSGPGNVNVCKKVYDYLGNAGWVNPETAGNITPANMATISKAKSVNGAQTKDIMIEVLNSEGTAVDKWQIKNAFVSTVALNNLDYAAEGVLTAEFTFRYDWAVLT